MLRNPVLALMSRFAGVPLNLLGDVSKTFLVIPLKNHYLEDDFGQLSFLLLKPVAC